MLFEQSADFVELWVLAIDRAQFSNETSDVLRVCKIDMFKWNAHCPKDFLNAVHQFLVLHT